MCSCTDICLSGWQHYWPSTLHAPKPKVHNEARFANCMDRNWKALVAAYLARYLHPHSIALITVINKGGHVRWTEVIVHVRRRFERRICAQRPNEMVFGVYSTGASLRIAFDIWSGLGACALHSPLLLVSCMGYSGRVDRTACED